MNNLSKVAEYLENLGLTAQESKVYCGLIETGPTTVKLLAERVGNQRANTHFIVESLIKKGLVYQTKEGARRRIVAEGVDKLKLLTDQTVAKYKSLETELPTVEKIVEDVIGAQTSHQTVNFKYFEGKKAVLNLIKNEFCKTDEAYAIVNLDHFYQVFPDIGVIFRKSYDDNPKRKVHAVVLDSKISRDIGSKERDKKYPNYFCKYVSADKYGEGMFNFAKFADYLFFDDSVVIIEFDEDNPRATMIKSRSVFLSFKSLYNHMWVTLED